MKRGDLVLVGETVLAVWATDRRRVYCRPLVDHVLDVYGIARRDCLPLEDEGEILAIDWIGYEVN